MNNINDWIKNHQATSILILIGAHVFSLIILYDLFIEDNIKKD